MTRTQSRIAVIWQDLLGVAEIETNTDFFALGGHSLLAIRLIARVSEEFGCQINTADLFRLPTIEGLTAVVEGRLAKDAGVTSVTPPPPAGAKAPFDCAAALSLRLVRAATGPSRGMVVGMPGLYGRSMETGVVAKALHDYDVWAFTLDIDGETLLKDDIGLSCAQEVARILLREDGWPLRALFGYSLGGFLAWLVDRLLVAAGREATPIVNLDGGAEHLRNSGWRASIDRLLPAGVQRAPAKMLLLCRAAPGQFVLPADAPAEWANAGVGPAVIAYRTLRHLDMTLPAAVMAARGGMKDFIANGALDLAFSLGKIDFDSDGGALFRLLDAAAPPDVAALRRFIDGTQLPDDGDTRVALLVLALASGDAEMALEVAQRMLKTNPAHRASMYAHVAVLSHMDRRAAAQSVAEAWCRARPADRPVMVRAMRARGPAIAWNSRPGLVLGSDESLDFAVTFLGRPLREPLEQQTSPMIGDPGVARATADLCYTGPMTAGIGRGQRVSAAALPPAPAQIQPQPVVDRDASHPEPPVWWPVVGADRGLDAGGA